MIKQNNGNIMIALLAVGLLVGVGVWYVITQRDIVPSEPTPTVTPTETTIDTSNDTSDWKTYVNDELGFSFKYPGYMILDFSRAGEEYKGTMLLEAHYEGPNNGENHFTDGMLIVFKKQSVVDGYESFPKYVNEVLIDKEMYLDDVDMVVSNEVINGLSAVRGFGFPSGRTETTSFFIEANEIIVNIDGFIRPQNDRKQYDAVFEAMIQSFTLER